MIADLDRFVRCSVAGCEWRIQTREGMTASRCYQHTGPAVAQYLSDSDGAIVRVRFMDRENDPDFDPLDAA